MDVFSGSINLLSFPVPIVVVDDDTDYLNLLQQLLHERTLYKYSSPIEALKSIDLIDVNTKFFLEENFVGMPDLNYKNVKDFVTRLDNKQGVLIVDYDMPEINGIELFSKINNPDLIKILLTNAYTIEEAVNALNKKLINYYLPKEKINTLLEVIKEQENNFFNDLTRKLISFVGASSLKFLSDSIYASIFNNICHQYNIKKYYILNSYGHYYLENNDSKFIFTIYDTADLGEIAIEVPKHAKHDVEQGNFIPSHFSNKDDEYKLVKAKRSGDYSYSIEQIDTAHEYS